jgi:hypothetical protein
LDVVFAWPPDQSALHHAPPPSFNAWAYGSVAARLLHYHACPRLRTRTSFDLARILRRRGQPRKAGNRSQEIKGDLQQAAGGIRQSFGKAKARIRKTLG